MKEDLETRQNVFITDATEFDEKKLVKDSSKVLQLVYETEVSAMRKLMLLAFVRKWKT